MNISGDERHPSIWEVQVLLLLFVSVEKILAAKNQQFSLAGVFTRLEVCFFLLHLLHIYFLIIGRLFVWKISRDYITDPHLENSTRKINITLKFPEAISYSWTLWHFQEVIQPNPMQAVDMRGQSPLQSLIWQRCFTTIESRKESRASP